MRSSERDRRWKVHELRRTQVSGFRDDYSGDEAYGCAIAARGGPVWFSFPLSDTIGSMGGLTQCFRLGIVMWLSIETTFSPTKDVDDVPYQLFRG